MGKIESLEDFFDFYGSVVAGKNEVCFIRILGKRPGIEEEIVSKENAMAEEIRQGKLGYYRLSEFPRILNQSDVSVYETILFACKKKDSAISFPHLVAKGQLAVDLIRSLEQVEALFRKEKKSVTDTIVKNFQLKLLYWLDMVGQFLWKKEKTPEKLRIVIENVSKEQEYYFCWFMTLLGCDVLLLQMEKDVDVTEKVLAFSHVVETYPFEKVMLPKYQPLSRGKAQTPVSERIQEKAAPVGEYKIDLTRRVSKPTKQLSRNVEEPRRERSFEELALLASSIVMIGVYGEDGEVHKTGSGIMIGREGFILTNFHVVAGGRLFAVRIEDDEQTYETSEIIKYNPNLDLAVIRIYRQLKPLPIYKGETKLVRGQKVVAIGSPLGLFNSVSDGIISGFRNIRNEDMIQFTAPISHGSSGGAVLNMYGEVIGISTAGIDEGQNINLAMGYESILGFAQGFIDK